MIAADGHQDHRLLCVLKGEGGKQGAETPSLSSLGYWKSEGTKSPRFLQPKWETFAAYLVCRFLALKQSSFSTGQLGQLGQLTCFCGGRESLIERA